MGPHTRHVLRVTPVLAAAFLFPLPGRAAPRGTTPISVAKPGVRLTVTPATLTLTRHGAPQHFLVSVIQPDGLRRDVTAQAQITAGPANIVRVENGTVVPLQSGRATLTVVQGTLRATVPVEARLPAQPQPVSFLDDVVPLLTRNGCNQGACHGAQSGKNGFKLSLLGYDPDLDYESLLRQGGGRRIQRTNPGASLLVTKALGIVPHQGGARFQPDSPESRTLLRWIAEGAPGPVATEPAVQQIEITPAEAVLAPNAGQQLVVTAHYADGSARDVTSLSRFVSNQDPVAAVDSSGHVRMLRTGEAVVRASFRGQVAITRLAVPFGGQVAPGAADPWAGSVNALDRAIFPKLRRLRIVPSAACTDAEFLRRAHLDLTGVIPSVEETRKFLESQEPEKRLRLVDRLIGSPEFVDAWTYRLGDWLRNSRRNLGAKGNRQFHAWLREQIATNRPWDQMVRDLLTSRGSLWDSGPVNFYGTASGPNEWAEITSQEFLGVRIGCAKCHDHPFDRWTQNDYYRLSAFFARTQVKSGGERDDKAVVLLDTGEVKHPKTDAVMPARTLDGKVEATHPDRRQDLAEWLTARDNPWFARNIANRIWKGLMGRGLVEPVDDVRATNPASNDEALTVLTEHLVKNDFDVRSLIRLIANSRVYQLSAATNPSSQFDNTQFSHHVVRRLTAEQILDSLVAATGVPEKFPGVPLGPRAAQLTDTSVPSYLLDLFGRPARTSVCECEREAEPNLAQVLHIMNGESINRKITTGGSRLERLMTGGKPDAEIIDELFLATLTRHPTERERAGALKAISESGARQDTFADLAWALLNSREFLFTH